MSCALNTPSGKELLTNSIKEKLFILGSEREKLRSLLSEVSNYEVTDEEKEWLLSFLLDKDFHLVNKELALHAIDNSRLARYGKNLITLQDACDSILDGVTRFLGSALSQNYMGCVMLNRYLNEIEFIDVIAHVPEEVLQALRGDLELLSTPITICLKDLIKFVGEGVVTKLIINGSAPNTTYHIKINKPNIYYECLEATLCPNQGSLIGLKFGGVCLMKPLCRKDRDLLSKVLDEEVKGEEKLNPEVKYKKFTKQFI